MTPCVTVQTMTDPDQLIADYEEKAAQVQRQAERIRDGLTAVRVTERTSAFSGRRWTG